MIFNSNAAIGRRIERTIKEGAKQARENLSWIGQHLPTSFLASLGDEPQAAAVLAASLHTLVHNRRLILADREDCLIQALVNCPGTLANTLRTLHDRQISFAEFGHSDAAIPGLDATLEIQRFVFGRTSWQDLACAPQTAIPAGLKASVTAELKRLDPEYAAKKFDHLLRILWVNNENYVRGLSPEEVARILHLFRNVNANSGIHVSLEEMADPSEKRGFRVRFGVHNPPQRGFLLQVMEVFRQMVIPVDYACCITLSAEFHPIFLADFHIMKGADPRTTNCEQLFKTIQTELFNTQILSIHSPTYAIYSEDKLVTGDEASLIDAFAAFCHTTLAHTHPDSFDQEGVTRAFHAHLDITRHLVKLFMAKFDPDILDRQELFARLLEEATHLIDSYNTGRRFLDEFRRVIFRCCLSLIRNTVKTNYFVVDKQALSFRIDPAYLDELDRSFTADLPAQRPVPRHLLLLPLRRGLSRGFLGHRPGRLAHGDHPRPRRLRHRGQHRVPGGLCPGPHPAPQEQGHLPGRLQAGGRAGLGDQGRPGGHHLGPLQAPMELHQRLPGHHHHHGRPGPPPPGGGLLPGRRAHRDRPGREHARPDDRGHGPAVQAAGLHPGHRHHVQQTGGHRPQGVRGHLHRGVHLRRGGHAPPGPGRLPGPPSR